MGTTQDEIVAATLAVLDEHGLDGVTMRAVAARLGVQHNTVRWHASSKGRLLELASDELLAHCLDEPLPEAFPDRLKELSRRCRTALLSHRDAARMVAGVFAAEPHTLRYADTVIATLLAAGHSPRTAAWTHWTIFYLILGLTQEQQAAQEAAPALLPDQVPADDYPALVEVLPYCGPDSFDQRFDFALGLIIAGLPRTEGHLGPGH
ncbi:putative transcriptional regulator, TetR family protein [Streptomyces nigrescens]|uniref:Transcriptional regulator, TetR family protein n=2 Tax=Streptomyces TaxID=1883 RepID=A0ABM7ZUZ9_STRNI|nr:TetR/AcrR family transcriptional regulator C-terminal domain-containing protein [Streptomyces nigrescens]MEE4423376.1 TetR/AcrR family transcriptional regulator C-terminal domain-containing protein [Streptomyces sp. DSM 41528]BDM70141.1 putative transcriptional regulator, TetR family protein [Streptomyces nigrescens]